MGSIQYGAFAARFQGAHRARRIPSDTASIERIRKHSQRVDGSSHDHDASSLSGIGRFQSQKSYVLRFAPQGLD